MAKPPQKNGLSQTGDSHTWEKLLISVFCFFLLIQYKLLFSWGLNLAYNLDFNNSSLLFCRFAFVRSSFSGRPPEKKVHEFNTRSLMNSETVARTAKNKLHIVTALSRTKLRCSRLCHVGIAGQNMLPLWGLMEKKLVASPASWRKSFTSVSLHPFYACVPKS